jgi:hypothetical protein
MDIIIIVLIVLFSILFLETLFLTLLLVMIVKTIGMKQLRVYYKVFKKKRDGYICGRIYGEDRVAKNIFLKKNAAQTAYAKINPSDSSESEFILNSKFIYTNEAGLPTIDYNEKDIEPRDPLTNRDYVTNPQMFRNITQGVIKSQLSLKNLLGYLKHPVVIGVVVVLGILFLALIFILLNQNQTITELSIKAAGTKVVN